jgi:hypothetical protein
MPVGIGDVSRQLFGIAHGHTYLRSLLLFLRAGFLSLSALHAFAIFDLHFVRAFLASRVAECAARAPENGHSAKQSHEYFHFTDSLFVTD